MASLAQQYREWRRNLPEGWEAPDGTIATQAIEDALIAAYMQGATNRVGTEGLAEDVKRYLTFVDEPKYLPPAQFRRAAMHKQQVTDSWNAMAAAMDFADLAAYVTASVRMLMSIGHSWAEFGVPHENVWQIARVAYKAKKTYAAGGECEYEPDGRIKWPTSPDILQMFEDEITIVIAAVD